LAIFAFAFLISTHPSELNTAKPARALEYLLSQRMSIRNWRNAPVEDEIMKTICKDSLTSAFDLEGIGLFMSNSTGTYQYDQRNDLFVLKSPGDARYQLGLDVGQTFVANAPCILTLIWDDTIERNPLDASRKAGTTVQNLYILAVRHNLGGVCVGDGIYADKVTINIQEHLGLPSNLKPVVLFPIGYLPAGKSYPTGSLQPTLGNLPDPLESSTDVKDLFQKEHQLSTAWENIGVSQQRISNILWATYGYSLLGTGHRTVPSANDEYPFQIYLCNGTGVYNYAAESHSLYQTSFIDKRSDIINHANAPKYLEIAPVLLVFCWNSQVGTHNASDADSRGRFINIGYGCCLQNLFLSATEWNISVSNSFYTDNYDALRRDVYVPSLPNIYPMYLVGLGETYKDPPLIPEFSTMMFLLILLFSAIGFSHLRKKRWPKVTTKTRGEGP